MPVLGTASAEWSGLMFLASFTGHLDLTAGLRKTVQNQARHELAWSARGTEQSPSQGLFLLFLGPAVPLSVSFG